MQGQVLCGFVRCGGGQLFKGIRTVQGDQGMYEVDSKDIAFLNHIDAF